MTDFPFLLSLGGLLLGFAAIEPARRFAGVIGARERIAIGALTPLLAIFLLFDLASLWMWVWSAREVLHVSPETLLGGLAAGIIYFIAAASVFPRNPGEWETLDAHYWRNKRIVVGGVIAVNAAATGFTLSHGASVIDARFLVVQGMYWLPLLGLLFSRRAWLDLSLLCVATLSYVVFFALHAA